MTRAPTSLAAALALAAAMFACASRAAAGPARHGSSAPSSAGPITGQWIVEPGERPSLVRLTIQRNQGSRRHHMSSNDDVPAAAFRGLEIT